MLLTSGRSNAKSRSADVPPNGLALKEIKLVATAATAAFAATAAAAVAVEQAAEGAEASMLAFAAARGLAAGGGAAASFAQDLLLDGAGHHAASRVGLADRNATADHAGALNRDLVRDGNRVGFTLGLGDTTGLANRDGLLGGDHLVDRHHALFRDALDVAFHAGAGNLDGLLAGNPNLDGLGPGAGRFAAGGLAAAAGVTATAAVALGEQAVQAFAEARAAFHFLAFIMTLVDGLADHRGDGHAGDDPLDRRPLFLHRRAHAHRADFLNLLRHGAIASDVAGAGFGGAFGPVRSVLFRNAFPFVDGAGGRVRFGDVLGHANGLVRGAAATAVAGRSGLGSWCGCCRSGNRFRLLVRGLVVGADGEGGDGDQATYEQGEAYAFEQHCQLLLPSGNDRSKPAQHTPVGRIEVKD